MMTVTDGKRVSIEYTVTLEDQTQVDTNVGGAPLTYTQGEQQVLPALQKKIVGLAAGESTQAVLSPDEAYGAVNPNAFQAVDKNRISEEAQKVGTQLETKDASGRTQHPRVHHIEENTVVLDFNHPLAGKTLTVDVKVLEVEESSS